MTGYTAPTAPAVGDQATASFATTLVNAINWVAGPPAFVGYQAAAQSPASGSYVPVTIDTSVVDTYSGHSSSTNPSRYTAPAAGWYRVSGNVAFTPNGTGRRLAKLTKNGTDVAGSQREANPSGTSGATCTVSTTALVQMAAGDYVELQAFQSSGAPLAMSVASPSGSYLDVEWRHS